MSKWTPEQTRKYLYIMLDTLRDVGHDGSTVLAMLREIVGTPAAQSDMDLTPEQEGFCASHCCWSGHHPDCARAAMKEAKPESNSQKKGNSKNG